MTTPATPTVPDDLLREIAAGADPIDPDELLTNPTFLGIVDRAYTAGRVQAFQAAAEMVEGIKPQSTNGGSQRALEAYGLTLATALRITAKLVAAPAVEVQP